MAETPALTLAERIAAAQAWWREAGVDLEYRDEPQGWLAEPHAEVEPEAAAPATAESPSPRPEIGGARTGWPQDLESFGDWWLAEPSLDEGGTFPRVAPRGPASAPLMVLVPMPEADDRDTLLGGREGRLLASFALAMGLAPKAVYFAAALPRHTPHPDWQRLAARGLGDVLRHHVALARPERLIVFGRDVSSLLGHDPAQAAPTVSELEIQDRKLPLLVSYAPDRLLQNAGQRARLWQGWLQWTDGDSV